MPINPDRYFLRTARGDRASQLPNWWDLRVAAPDHDHTRPFPAITDNEPDQDTCSLAAASALESMLVVPALVSSATRAFMLGNLIFSSERRPKKSKLGRLVGAFVTLLIVILIAYLGWRMGPKGHPLFWH